MGSIDLEVVWVGPTPHPLLEVLAHTNTRKVPPSHRCVMTDVPDDLPVSQFNMDDLPEGWDRQDSAVAQKVGDNWLQLQQSAVLIIPLVVTRIEVSARVNPAHPQAARIRISEAVPVH